MLIDCDANATYAPCEEIRGVIAACLDIAGNPSSLHRAGQRARAELEEARAVIRAFVGAGAHDSIVFTSGASEANNTVISSCAARSSSLIVASAIEHPCVLEPLERLRRSGRDVSFVKPDEQGRVLAQSVSEAVRRECALVSVMAANNETGVLNPVREIARLIKQAHPSTLVHTDAAQVAGKMPLSFTDLGVDFMTISGHKFGAPAGVGILIVRHGAPLEALILGGPQEGKLRGGTENVFAISAMARVAAAISPRIQERAAAMESARRELEGMVLSKISGAEINGAGVARLPNTASIFIPQVRAADLVVALDLEGILVSSGAACSSGKPEPSHVLQAMSQDDARVRSTVRVSFRADVKPEHPAIVAQALARAAERAGKVGAVSAG